MEHPDKVPVIKVTRDLPDELRMKNPIAKNKQVASDLNPKRKQVISLLTVTRVLATGKNN
jgi:hypothetical protein